MQATVSPMMQTVIRWRRPSDCEYSRYPSPSNPCSYLLGNSVCYVVSGCLLLVVGVIITSLTFQNLDSSNGENKERYAGPVLIAGGVLVMARGAVSRMWPLGRSVSSRRRSLLRRYISELYNSRPIIALQRNSAFSLCDLEVSGLYHVSRARLYSDDPPSYDTVTSEDYLYADMCVHAYTNPANDFEEDFTNDHILPAIVITSCTPSTPHHQDQHIATDEHCPPPSYDEYILSENMKITTL